MNRLALILFMLGSSPAVAFETRQLGQGGSLFLSDIMPVIETSRL
jgi:hypothetical protein